MRRRDFITVLGGAAGWPFAARAQQTNRMRRIGLLASFTESYPEGQGNLAAFREALQSLGWTDGLNVHIDYRWGGVDFDRARAPAAELAALAPDVIFVEGAPAVAAMREQTRTLPIVFIQSGDPVQAGSVRGFARPGSNFTGFTSFESTINAKYLQLLKDIAPNVTRVAVMQFENSTWRGDFSAIEAVARSFAVRPIAAVVHDAGEIEPAMAALAQEPNGGLILPPDGRTASNKDLIVALATKYLLPAIYSDRPFTAGGGLMSYGVDRPDIFRRAASYVDRILKGEKPSDLPVQAPTKFELVINLKTAKALGLAVSRDMLLIADEVIE
jgi:putative tryptophan/tyrosine transport system substrate-binding protein